MCPMWTCFNMSSLSATGMTILSPLNTKLPSLRAHPCSSRRALLILFCFVFFFLLTLYTMLIYNTTLVCLLTQFTTIIQLQITDNYRDNYLQR